MRSHLLTTVFTLLAFVLSAQGAPCLAGCPMAHAELERTRPSPPPCHEATKPGAPADEPTGCPAGCETCQRAGDRVANAALDHGVAKPHALAEVLPASGVRVAPPASPPHRVPPVALPPARALFLTNASFLI